MIVEIVVISIPVFILLNRLVCCIYNLKLNNPSSDHFRGSTKAAQKEKDHAEVAMGWPRSLSCNWSFSICLFLPSADK